MKTLGLDIATTTGWAIAEAAEGKRTLFHCGEWALGKTDGRGLLTFDKKLELQLAQGVTRVACEDVLFIRSRAQGHSYGALRGMVLKTCYDWGVPVLWVPVQRVKRHATGSGAADKADMVAAASKRFGPSVAGDAELTDNMADALWVLDYALQNP